MASDCEASVTNAFPISYVGGRYMLFDINVVTALRRHHHILGVLIGSIPQIPQQNVFLGLPMQLLPEEARLLVEKGRAYIIEDAAWHKMNFRTLQGEDRKRYLASLKSEGWKAKKAAEAEAQKRTEMALAKQAAKLRSKHIILDSTTIGVNAIEHNSEIFEEYKSKVAAERVSVSQGSISPSQHPSDPPYGITRTLTIADSNRSGSQPPQTDEYFTLKPPSAAVLPTVPKAYPLFAHLHAHDFFITPGLRFGCDYTVYPGDPLRYHSHFLATGYQWEDEIPLLDLVGGGRLGTGVKKAFMIGGENSKADHEGEGEVRTFCLEWGGM